MDAVFLFASASHRENQFLSQTSFAATTISARRKGFISSAIGGARVVRVGNCKQCCRFCLQRKF
jgi:hypothetical protein